MISSKTRYQLTTPLSTCYYSLRSGDRALISLPIDAPKPIVFMEPPSPLPKKATRRRRITQPTPSSSVLQIDQPVAKKPRGRPKGSKNASIPQPEALPSSLLSPTAKDWATDGDGRSPSSLSLLIEWLGMRGHFDQWKFGAKGKTQTATDRDIAAWLSMRKPGCGRSSTAVHNKVSGSPPLLCPIDLSIGYSPVYRVERGFRLEELYRRWWGTAAHRRRGRGRARGG